MKRLIVIIYLPVLVWCSWVYSQTGVFGMSSQRGEHYRQYILPHIAQYSEGVPMIEGMRQGIEPEITPEAVAKAWYWGAMKTLLSPAIPDLLNLAGVDRQRFSYVEGVTDYERAQRMLTGWIGTAYIVNVVILALFYMLCFRGVVRMGSTGLWLGLICLAVVVITGPVGFAKYRLIMEPFLCLMAGRGINGKESILLD